MQLNDLTVIVPTKNEANNLPCLIESIPPEIHLVVVDASQDGTPDLVLRLRPKHTTVICTPDHIAAARNLGAQIARTRWLSFTDADITFAPDYFDHLKTSPYFYLRYGPKLSSDQQFAFYQNFSTWQARLHRLGIPAVSGSNLVVNAQTFHRMGGFRRDLLVNEDTEFGYRTKKAGYPVEFDPSMVVYARDHRRLRQGKLRKNLHTLARCALIYMNVLPGLWSGRDWGYWSKKYQ
jgi:glycosyltransferase involved in cell wall biosynthesis